MPNLKTYHDNKNIYSVDLMIAYINRYGHPVVDLPIEEFSSQLKMNVWGNWSPMDVIEKPHLKKYKSDVERIKHADLAFPVFVTAKHDIVDGFHRIAKAHIEHKQHVMAYVFDSELMKKFIIDKDMNFVKVHQKTSVSDVLELWSKRF